MTQRKYSLYVATAPDGRKYVGCTGQPLQSRLRSYHTGVRNLFGPPATLYEALCFFGSDSFHFEQIASATSPAKAAACEEALMRQHGALRPQGLNVAAISGVRGKHKLTTTDIARDWMPVSTKPCPIWPPSREAA